MCVVVRACRLKMEVNKEGKVTLTKTKDFHPGAGAEAEK